MRVFLGSFFFGKYLFESSTSGKVFYWVVQKYSTPLIPVLQTSCMYAKSIPWDDCVAEWSEALALTQLALLIMLIIWCIRISHCGASCFRFVLFLQPEYYIESMIKLQQCRSLHYVFE